MDAGLLGKSKLMVAGALRSWVQLATSLNGLGGHWPKLAFEGCYSRAMRRVGSRLTSLNWRSCLSCRQTLLFHKPENDLANAKKLPPLIIRSLSRA
jgi:hypothetical protein